MINFTCEPFCGGELVRFSFSDEGTDEAWKVAIDDYLARSRLPHQYFLIDNRGSLGTARPRGISYIFCALIKAGVTGLRVAQVSNNPGFNIIARLTE